MPGIYDVICVKNRLKWEKVSAMIPVNVDNGGVQAGYRFAHFKNRNYEFRD